MTATTGGVTGYESVKTPWTGGYWKGLEKHLQTYCLLDGVIHLDLWGYAVGLTVKWAGDKIPGPCSPGNNTAIQVTRTELWVYVE